MGSDQFRLYDSLPFGTVVIMGREYTHLNTADSVLDGQFVKLAACVEATYREVLLSRQERLRCEAWVHKLAEMLCCDRVPLLKNRNNYAKQLMRSLTEIGKLEGVFKKMPPQGASELQTLQKHQILEIEAAIKANQANRRAAEAKKV